MGFLFKALTVGAIIAVAYPPINEFDQLVNRQPTLVFKYVSKIRKYFQGLQ